MITNDTPQTHINTPRQVLFASMVGTIHLPKLLHRFRRPASVQDNGSSGRGGVEYCEALYCLRSYAVQHKVSFCTHKLSSMTP